MSKSRTSITGTVKSHGFSIPKRCVVTGGSGFVGQRLVEMLVDRGAEMVVSFDISPKPKNAMESPKIKYVQGDLTNLNHVQESFKDTDCVFHIAALVGPYHPKDAYVKVNYEGTLNILSACKKYDIKKIVFSSSPSTRFPYPDPNVYNLTEKDLFEINKGLFFVNFTSILIFTFIYFFISEFAFLII